MQKTTINHRRVVRLVKSIIDYEVHKARNVKWQREDDPKSEALAAMEKNVKLPGIEFDDRDGIRRDYVTINDELLALIGYDDNTEGFLYDYFGSDYKHPENEPLRFRFIEGELIAPTRFEKKTSN